MNVLLGTNLINNCESALFVNNEEVFRFRESTTDGQLLCDFDVRGKAGNRIAKIAKNQVVFSAEGFQYKCTKDESKVLDKDGNIFASVKRIDKNTLKITGTFCINGHEVIITDNALISSGVTMTGNIISGFGKAIAINPGNFSIGCR